MSAHTDQSCERLRHYVHIENLPADVTARQITDLFEQFGTVVRLFLRRRISRDSDILLPHPYVTLIFDQPECIDQIMAGRPYVMKDCELFVRRCLPITPRYPYETKHTTNKMLVRIPRENHGEILPNDELIADYFKLAGGQILRLERWDATTVLVEFDDYDPVDVCCLARPHFIRNQCIEIEKCTDEQQARCRAEYRQKTHSTSFKLSPTPAAVDGNTQFADTISPTLALNTDEQAVQLQLTYEDTTHRLEDEHERLLSSLKSELEQVTKERIRLQRLTLDYQQEQKRLSEENRQWQRLFSESLLEKPRVQAEGERRLVDAKEKCSRMQSSSNQLT